jgi:hypothetical protein
MLLNVTSLIPVGKSLQFPVPVPWFLRIMTSNPGDFWKRGTTGSIAGSVVPEFLQVFSGPGGEMSPTEVSHGGEHGG